MILFCLFVSYKYLFCYFSACSRIYTLHFKLIIVYLQVILCHFTQSIRTLRYIVCISILVFSSSWPLYYYCHVFYLYICYKSHNIYFFLFFKFLFIYLFIYLFMAVLGLRFCARAFSSCGKRGPLFIAVHGPLTIAASLVAEHRLQMRRLSDCGSWAQLLHGMWDLPRPGL